MGSPACVAGPALQAMEPCLCLCVQAAPSPPALSRSACSLPRISRVRVGRSALPPSCQVLQLSSHNVPPPCHLAASLAHHPRPSCVQRLLWDQGRCACSLDLGTDRSPAERVCGGERPCTGPAHSPRGLAGRGGLHCLSVQAPPAKQQSGQGAAGGGPRAGRGPPPSPAGPSLTTGPGSPRSPGKPRRPGGPSFPGRPAGPGSP